MKDSTQTNSKINLTNSICSPAILFTQCLQNDFVQPIEKYDPIPNLLHVGYNESLRLMGENPREGALVAFMDWAMSLGRDQLEIFHIRDWHDSGDNSQVKHLHQFGDHCIRDTKGAEFVYQSSDHSLWENKYSKNGTIIDASGLNDIFDTTLESKLEKYKSTKQEIFVGIIGVWTEAKVSFLAYELSTRYPNFNIAISSALTASSSRSMHYISLDQMKNILGVEIFPSIGAFSEFLTGNSLTLTPGHKNFENKVKFLFHNPVNKTKEDEDLLYYLFRDCKSVEFFTLDGGFSGNLVLRAKSIDAYGHSQVPTVIKIGERDPISKERSSFERIEEVLGNSAPRIVDFAEIGLRGAIKYRYASMMDGKTKVFQDLYEDDTDLEEIFGYLDVVFLNQLGRLYEAGEPEKLNLLEYYDFHSKYAESVEKRVKEILEIETDSTDDKSYYDKNISIEKDPINLRFPSSKENKSLSLYNLIRFYREDLENWKEISSQPHYVSYLHGDLNGKNIIVDTQKNVWLIDFFHTHRGHILKDLIKLENDILYIFMKISEDAIDEAISLLDLLREQPDLGIPLDEKWVENFTHPKIRRAFLTIRKLRSYYPNLIRLDRDPYQLHIGLLRYSVHTLSFDECSLFQKKLALYSSSKLAEKIKNTLVQSKKLRIDFLEIDSQKRIGMTILPGRKDRNRSLTEDIKAIKEENISKVYSLIKEVEYYEYGVSGLKWAYEEAGLEFVSYPILDQRVPDTESIHELLEDMHITLENGKSILVHCVGGLGRSGTIVALYLIKYHSMTAEEAIRKVRIARSPRAIESKEQIEFLENFQNSIH